MSCSITQCTDCSAERPQEKYKLKLPAYPGASQCVKIASAGAQPGADPAGIRLSYTLSEESGGLREQDVLSDPIAQVWSWLS